MELVETKEAKDRIIAAAIELFAQKGFDATRVNEIADEAKVNKALIYYYFKNKADILDHLVRSLLNDVTEITINFIHANIIKMIENERLQIKLDRLHFVDDHAITEFLENVKDYYERILDFTLENRQIIRILMLESLKKSKHQNGLFKLLNLTPDNNNQLYTTISKAGINFNYSEDIVLFKFFFSIIPLVSFAAYFDDFQTFTGQSQTEMRQSFLDSYTIIADSLISGQEILFKNKYI